MVRKTLHRSGWLCLLVASIALPVHAGRQRPTPRLPRDLRVAPLVSQPWTYDCGGASALSVFAYWGKLPGGRLKSYRLTNTRSAYGTLMEDIARGAQRLGLRAEVRSNCTLRDLGRALRRREPVIVQLQAWRDEKTLSIPWAQNWDNGHYVVVVGLDKHHVYFMDPSAKENRRRPKDSMAYAFIPRREFLDRWHEWDLYGKQAKHFYQPAIFIRGDQPVEYRLGTFFDGTRFEQIPVRPPVRME